MQGFSRYKPPFLVVGNQTIGAIKKFRERGLQESRSIHHVQGLSRYEPLFWLAGKQTIGAIS